MHFDFVQSLGSATAVFTVGDLCEGLGFLEPNARRAVVFGLEQRLTCSDVIEMTHAGVAKLQLTPFATAAVKQCPRHIRLHYVFWGQLQDGMITPLLNLERQVEGAFGGMSWMDLRAAYERMVWVDHQHDTEHFLMMARRHGVI